MTVHPFRIVAGVLLTTGGFVVAVSALAIVTGPHPRRRRDGGPSRRRRAPRGPRPRCCRSSSPSRWPTSSPALGLLGGRAWADNVAIGSAAIAVAIGTVGLLLVVVGRDPFGPVASTAGPSVDGIEMLAGFTLLYLAVIVSLVAARAPRRPVTMGAAA